MRIEDLKENLPTTLRERSIKFEYCSLVLNDSCDISDISQLVIFLHGNDTKLNTTEEWCSLIPMLGLAKTCTMNLVFIKKYDRISTNGAWSMSSMEVWVSEKVFQDIKKVTGSEIFVKHYIIHQEHLCAKILSLPNVTVPNIKLINFINLGAIGYREFKEFLKDLETEYGDVVLSKA